MLLGAPADLLLRCFLKTTRVDCQVTPKLI
jgi:hypothetical protein